MARLPRYVVSIVGNLSNAKRIDTALRKSNKLRVLRPRAYQSSKAGDFEVESTIDDLGEMKEALRSLLGDEMFAHVSVAWMVP